MQFTGPFLEYYDRQTDRPIKQQTYQLLITSIDMGHKEHETTVFNDQYGADGVFAKMSLSLTGDKYKLLFF